MARTRALSSPRSEAGRDEHRIVFRNGFLIVSGLAPTQEGAGPRIGGGEGDEAGEMSMTALTGRGVVGADMLLLGECEGWSFVAMVMVLICSWALRKFLTSSSACMSSSLTHESCAGEYPFHLTRYCFFFHQLKVCCFRIDSTSHSDVSSMMSGGGSRKFGPCSSVSLYGVKRGAWKML